MPLLVAFCQALTISLYTKMSSSNLFYFMSCFDGSQHWTEELNFGVRHQTEGPGVARCLGMVTATPVSDLCPAPDNTGQSRPLY